MEFDPPEREVEELLLELLVELLGVDVGAGVVAIDAVVVALADEGEAVVCPETRCGMSAKRK